MSVAAAARADLAKRSLYEFVRQSAPILEPGTEFEWNWHIWALCFHIQMMLEGWLVANRHVPKNGNIPQQEIRNRARLSWELHGLKFEERKLLVQNMIANLPPGTYKSRILMVCAPAWMWLHCPTWSVCCISGTDDNVKRDSHEHRQLVESEWYRGTFGITWTIEHRQSSVANWATTAGGIRKSRTLLGNVTGIHVDAMFLDDPDDAHKVFSEPKRRDVQYKWSRAWKNRVKSLALCLRIAIQQRVHVEDWTSAQVAKAVWKPHDRRAWSWLVMPLRWGQAPKHAPVISPFGWMDPRSVANDNLHPSRFPDDVIADEMRDKGPDGFAAQYDQNPERLDSGWIKRAYVKFFRLQDEPIPDVRKRPAGCGLVTHGKPSATVNRNGDFVSSVDVEYEDAYVLAKDRISGAWDLDWLTITIDCSMGSKSRHAAATSILVVGGKEQRRFVFGDRTGVYGPEEMFDAICNTVRDFPAQKVIIELAALGQSSIDRLRLMIATGDIRWPNGEPAIVEVIEIRVGGESKEQRFRAMLPAWAAGLVYVLDGADWLHPVLSDEGRVIDLGYVGEICGFPQAAKRDRADAMSQVMIYHAEHEDVMSSWRAMARISS
jgi:phage terminase large subunit-like protein